MKKEVLVSISGKHIDIMNDPTAGYETGDDDIEVVRTENIISSMTKCSKEWRERYVIRSRSPGPTA